MLPSPDTLMAQILQATRTIAVVGFSTQSHKAGYYVPAYMHRQGYRILPVNPNLSEWEGGPVYAALADIPEPIDMVNIFRRPEHVASAVAEALAVGARAFWVQLGITSPDARALTAAAAVPYVEDRCLMVEHRRLAALGRLGRDHDRS